MKTEAQIQKECNSFLRARGWHVERFTGNAFQKGIPDVQLFHLDHGFRWVDYKRTKGGVLTRAQRIKWPQWEAAGIGIWILTSTEDSVSLPELAKVVETVL